jgi:hypothetical protein
MPNYVLVYRGGGGMAQDEAARQQIMDAWGRWFGSLADALVDGGNPFGPSASVSPGGGVTEGAPSALTGYSIIKSDSLKQATESARGCPILTDGGSVEVYETVPVM